MQLSRGFRLIQNVREIRAHDGRFYVTDCQPWAIKPECERLDCPMRTLAVAPEAKEGDALFECDPVGSMADTLISIQNMGGSE
jgi:hypothetical protein